MSKKLTDIRKEAVGADMPDMPPSGADHPGEKGDENPEKGTTWEPLETSIGDELNEAGTEATRELRERQRAMLDTLDLRQ